MNIDDQASEDAKPYNRKKTVQKQSSLSSWEDLGDDHHDDYRHSFKEIPNNLQQRDNKEDLDSSQIWFSTQKDIKSQNPDIRFNIKSLLLIIAILCSFLSLLISINTYLRFSRNGKFINIRYKPYHLNILNYFCSIIIENKYKIVLKKINAQCLSLINSYINILSCSKMNYIYNYKQ